MRACFALVLATTLLGANAGVISRSKVSDDANDITDAALQLAGEVTGAAGDLASDRGNEVAGEAAEIAGAFLTAAGSANDDSDDTSAKASKKESKSD